MPETLLQQQGSGTVVEEGVERPPVSRLLTLPNGRSLRRVHSSEEGERTLPLLPRKGDLSNYGKSSWVFWYGFEGSWIEFVDRTGIRSDSVGTHRYEVLLAPDTRLLTISTEEQFTAFQAEYGVESRINEVYGIEWESVAEQYDALEIVPHMEEMRRNPWYWGWDLASGVVFEPDKTVVGLELIEECPVRESLFLSDEHRSIALDLRR